MDDSDDEVFEDALEVPFRPEHMDLDAALDESRMAVNLFFNNQFDEAREILTPWVGKSMYHTVGNAVFEFLEAVLTFDQAAIQKASDALKDCLNLCEVHRKKHSLSHSIGKMVWKSNYNSMTPVEIHAELCYAEALLLKSMLIFIEDETLVSFIKAGLKIRTCFNSYKECSSILKARNWADERHKIHFQSGVHVGIGTFNLMISMLPARVIKLLEFIGFSGSKEVGLEELHCGYELKGGIRHVLSVMTLLTYNLIVVYVVSHEDGDLDLCEEILNYQLHLYPEGAWFLFFKGRLEFMRGNLSEANAWYTKSWKSQNIWPQFHHLCFWELMWTKCISSQWEEAATFAGYLLCSSKWSRTIYGYQKAALLLMLDKLSPQQMSEVENILRNLPDWRQRIAGKSLPMEKFCAKRSFRYFAQKNQLVLPAIELMYLWNCFKVITKNWNLTQKMYNVILEALGEAERGRYTSTEFEYDNLGLLLLLKGACLSHQKQYSQAEDCIRQLLKLEKRIKEDTFLIPFGIVELALIHNHQGASDKAVQLLDDVKKNYSGYSLESRLHFRIHAALLELTKKKK